MQAPCHGTCALRCTHVLPHIVDGNGAFLTAGWTVSANHNWNSGLGGRTAGGARASVDPATGQFRIEGLPPGKLQVNASSGTLRIEPVEAVTRQGVERCGWRAARRSAHRVLDDPACELLTRCRGLALMSRYEARRYT
jgi:hypothetical protein